MLRLLYLTKTASWFVLVFLLRLGVGPQWWQEIAITPCVGSAVHSHGPRFGCQSPECHISSDSIPGWIITRNWLEEPQTWHFGRKNIANLNLCTSRRAVQSSGQAMGLAVVGERALWLGLLSLSEKEKCDFLMPRLTPQHCLGLLSWICTNSAIWEKKRSIWIMSA